MSVDSYTSESQSFNQSESDEESQVLIQEVIEFTDLDRFDVIAVLELMAYTLENREDELSSKYGRMARLLKQMPLNMAFDYLKRFLNAETLFDVNHARSFIFLKQVVEDTKSPESQILEKKLSEMIVLNLTHLVFYKALPCELGNLCKHYPRKIVHKNDFSDLEIDCFYYHHEKDKRRFVLNDGGKEFRYAGNFADNRRSNLNKMDFSQNFFESLFHPLYYKNFTCVRTKCEKSIFCPYYHSNQEKCIWNTFFKVYFGKDREVFTKKRAIEDEKPQKSRNSKRQIAYMNTKTLIDYVR